jgi:hypothetical protein
MMEADRLKKILHDVIMDKSPEDSNLDYTAEDHERRGVLEQQVADMEAKGIIPDIPHEWPSFTTEEMADIKSRQPKKL